MLWSKRVIIVRQAVAIVVFTLVVMATCKNILPLLWRHDLTLLAKEDKLRDMGDLQSLNSVLFCFLFLTSSFSWSCQWLSCTFLQTLRFKCLCRILHRSQKTAHRAGNLHISLQITWSSSMHPSSCTGTTIQSYGRFFWASVKHLVTSLNVRGIMNFTFLNILKIEEVAGWNIDSQTESSCF